jgi:hypothetical protein
MERFNVIRDYCLQNSLTQIENSWIKTAGLALGIPQIPGKDDYERTVFLAITAVPTPAYKVYTALVSQTEVSQTSGVLEIGKEYKNYEVSPGDDFTNVGRISSAAFIATGTTPTVWTNGSNVIDVVASAPTAIVLQNTLGGVPTFVMDNNIGTFKCTLTGAFPASKTFTNINTYAWGVDQGHLFAIGRWTDNIIAIESAYSPANGANGFLNNTEIEIRVYN